MKGRAEPLPDAERIITERLKDKIGVALEEMEIEEILELVRQIEDELIKRRPFDR